MRGAADLHSRQCGHWTASCLANPLSADSLQRRGQVLQNPLAKRRPPKTSLGGKLHSATTGSATNAWYEALHSAQAPSCLHRHVPCQALAERSEKNSTSTSQENASLAVLPKRRQKYDSICCQQGHSPQLSYERKSCGSDRDCCRESGPEHSSQKQRVVSRRSTFQSLLGMVLAVALGSQQAPLTGDTFENVPRSLSSSGKQTLLAHMTVFYHHRIIASGDLTELSFRKVSNLRVQRWIEKESLANATMVFNLLLPVTLLPMLGLWIQAARQLGLCQSEPYNFLACLLRECGFDGKPTP